MSIFGSQIGAALTLLGETHASAAKGSGLSKVTITRIINDDERVKSNTRQDLLAYLQNKGIEFIDGGVRIRPKATVLQLEGHTGFIEFMRMVLKESDSPDVDICVSGVDERPFARWNGDFVTTYLDSMNTLYKKNKFRFRIIAEEGDDYDAASAYAQYRYVSSSNFTPAPIYVFANNVAQIEFEENSVIVWIIHSEKLATAHRKQFDLTWKSLK